MKHYEVRISDHAVEQMREIVQYISETLCAPDSARDLLSALRSSMAACAELPARNPALPREPWRSLGIRRIIVRNFYAYYWINEEDRQVWFISVIYSKRDQSAELLRAIARDRSPDMDTDKS